MHSAGKPSFRSALRLFSLVVAVISCGLGIRLGWKAAEPQWLLAVLLLTGGLLAQAGINLVNDMEDIDTADEPGLIRRNNRIGWGFFGLAAAIGCYLVIRSGWQLAVICGISAWLALSYHSGPLHFKRRGLALPLVFVLMGVIMVQASYFVMSGRFSWQVLWLSIPVSVLVSVLLLSNEIRDYAEDTAEDQLTFTVRYGVRRARHLYLLLVTSALLLTLAYAAVGWFDVRYAAFLVPAVATLPFLWRELYADDRKRLPPLTGLFFLLFGIASLIMAPST